MPTLAELRAEPWWDREIVTAEMDWLGDELCRRTNRPRTAAGTKGDVNHLRGAHRSQEWILNSRYCTNRTYTVQSDLNAEQLRDIAGFDFTPGSAEQMIAQCKRLLSAIKSGTLELVREFYGNVDGDQIVDGFDNVHNRITTSDSSHLWHWHLSIDRRATQNLPLMQRILAIALGDEDMPTAAEIADAVLNRQYADVYRRDPADETQPRVAKIHEFIRWTSADALKANEKLVEQAKKIDEQGKQIVELQEEITTINTMLENMSTGVTGQFNVTGTLQITEGT